MADWRVRADPAPEPVSFSPGQPPKVSTPEILFNYYMLYYSTPSSLAAPGGNGNKNQRREVWNLRDDKRIGGLIGRLGLNRLLVLFREADLLRRMTNDGPAARLATLDASVTDGQKVHLVVSFREKDTVQTVQLREISRSHATRDVSPSAHSTATSP